MTTGHQILHTPVHVQLSDAVVNAYTGITVETAVEQGFMFKDPNSALAAYTKLLYYIILV